MCQRSAEDSKRGFFMAIFVLSFMLVLTQALYSGLFFKEIFMLNLKIGSFILPYNIYDNNRNHRVAVRLQCWTNGLFVNKPRCYEAS